MASNQTLRLHPGKCYLIRVGEGATEVAPLNGKTFELPELYSMLECRTIEVLRIRQGTAWMVIDEEGKLTGKQTNMVATMLSELYPYDKIVGNALVCPCEFID